MLNSLPMTRSMFFRILLGMKMLATGDWASYWWLLPRRLKRYKNYAAYVRDEMGRALMAHCYKFALKSLAVRFQFEQIAPISKYSYRIPISYAS